jgi:hypothetical protein
MPKQFFLTWEPIYSLELNGALHFELLISIMKRPALRLEDVVHI